MFEEKIKLQRKEKRLINKLKTWKIYKAVTYYIYKIFSFHKVFLVLPKKTLAIISITVWTIFWKKVWYIDDFVVHKKARGKWIWKKLFTKAIDNLENQKADYAFLVSRNERKASHSIYKKFWFIVVSMWVWILAYKKLKNKKK